jgi:hypothetical protein
MSLDAKIYTCRPMTLIDSHVSLLRLKILLYNSNGKRLCYEMRRTYRILMYSDGLV